MTQKLSNAQRVARKDAVITAATGVFLRYGYSRTTMADLALAAQLSRPALYLLFPGKDEIFDAVIRELNTRMLEDFRQRLPKLRTLESRLQRVCADWGAHGLELMERHPDASDLFNLTFPTVREMYELFVQFLADLLAESGATSRLKVSPAELARNLVYSFRGLRETARDSRHLREMIRLQVEIVLTALNG
jgi:AcrR family transcriptional regulator